MPHHVERTRIEAPVDVVFRAMTDLDRWREWWPQIDRVRLPAGWADGSELACRVMGMDLEGRVTSYVANRELGFETRLPLGGRVTQHFAYAADGEATELTATIDAAGVAGMMFTRGRLLKELARLRANVEAGTAEGDS